MKPSTTKWWDNLIQTMSYRIFTYLTRNNDVIIQYFGKELLKMKNEIQIKYLNECQLKIEKSVRCFLVELWNNFYRSNVWKNNSTKSITIHDWKNGTDLQLTFNIRKQKGIQGMVIMGFAFSKGLIVGDSCKNLALSTFSEDKNNMHHYDKMVHPQLKKANKRLLEYHHMERKIIKLQNEIDSYKCKLNKLTELLDNEKKSTYSHKQ